MIDLNKIDYLEIVKGFRVKFVHSDNLTIAYWDIDKDAELPEHSHPNEQISSQIEGEFELTVDGKKNHMTPGNNVIIPPNAKHSGKALTDCKIIDVFYPCREDYKNM